MTAILIAAFLLWLFWPEKTRWHPFGGLYKWDKRTRRLTVVAQLPGKKAARKRKR